MEGAAAARSVDPSSAEESSEEEQESVVETPEVREKSLVQLQEAIEMLPQEERAALEEAQRQAPDLIQRESDPLQFLRFHSFNSWAAAKRLAAYWKYRHDVFQERTFLPMDLSGKGAMPLDDVRLFQYGVLMVLPNDRTGKPVLYVDRSKLPEDEVVSNSSIFFAMQKLMGDSVSGKLGTVCLINLSNPFGAIFQRDNVALAKDLFRKAMPLKTARLHVVCAPPAAVQGRKSFVASFVPLCLHRLGPFFSKHVELHIADSEESVLQCLSAHNFFREGLPAPFGGTWNGLDEWLESQNCSLNRTTHVDALIRNTLWAYAGQVATLTEHTESSSGSSDTKPFSTAEENLIQDRKKYEHFDIRDYTDEKHSGMSHEEREAILRDIYGTSDVEFTVTKGMEMEGRARAQFEEAIKMLPEVDKKDYLQAKERVPHLVEIESDPGRYLRVEEYNPWNAARRVALYWKNRKEVFGDRAFYPLTLSGKSALKQDEIRMIETAYMTILPNDDRGRPIYFHDLSRLTVPFTAESRTRCAFYIMQLASEQESSRNVGVVGIAAYAKKAPPGATNPKHGKKATEMARDGVFPCHWRVIHVCSVGMKSNTLRDRYFVPFTLQMLRYWKALSLRTIVHVDETPQAIRDRIAKYAIPPSSVPTSIGGTWTYEHDFTKWMEDRLEYEKATYGPFECNDEKSADEKMSAEKSEPDAHRVKKRKMDALYARRKRERMRIEVEVLQEQCVEYNRKNTALERQNKRLEGLLKSAQVMVQIHLAGGGGLVSSGGIVQALPSASGRALPQPVVPQEMPNTQWWRNHYF